MILVLMNSLTLKTFHKSRSHPDNSEKNKFNKKFKSDKTTSGFQKNIESSLVLIDDTNDV